MKRFTETSKWRDPWFRRLTPPAKLLWQYVCDNCISVGLIDLDLEAASFDIGVDIKESHVEEIMTRLQFLGSGKYFIPKFIHFQYGVLSPNCPPHKTVLKLIEQHQIEEVEGVYSYPNARVDIPHKNGKEEEEDKDRNGKPPEFQVFKPTPVMLRINKMFGRRDSTKWSKSELKSLAAIEPIQEDDFAVVEKHYRLAIPKEDDYRRHDLPTLLNNWNGEVDRARRFKPKREYNL